MRYLLALALLSIGGVASAAVIDFEGQAGVGYIGALEVDGYIFDAGTSAIGLYPGAQPDMELNVRAGEELGNDNLFVSLSDGGSFTFTSADVWFSGSLPGTYVDVIGQLAGGGTVNTQWLVGGFDPWLDPRTINSTFSDQALVSLQFVFDDSTIPGSTSITLDNFNLEAAVVPIPAAVWLFGSALAGLGWMRRKQTV